MENKGAVSGGLTAGKVLERGDVLQVHDPNHNDNHNVVLIFCENGVWSKHFIENANLNSTMSEFVPSRLESAEHAFGFGSSAPTGSLVIGAENVLGKLVVFLKTISPKGSEEPARLQAIVCFQKPWNCNIVTYTDALEIKKAPTPEAIPKVFPWHVFDRNVCF